MTADAMPRPSFDHCYRSIENDAVYQRFASLGFKLNPDPVIHPGRLKCQFLHFLSPAGASVYLEFIFRDETRPLSPEKPEDGIIHAGFALKIAKDLHQALSEYQTSQPQLNAKFEHRNYDLKADARVKQPGWNFLTFESPPVPGVEVWLIEYEPIPGRTEAAMESLRQKYRGMTEHPNTARRILGFLWKAIDMEQLGNFEAVTRAASSCDGMTLEGGTKVRFVQEEDPYFDLFRDKRNPFLAVIVGVNSLQNFMDSVVNYDLVEVFGMKAVRIRLDDNSWDMIAVEATIL